MSDLTAEFQRFHSQMEDMRRKDHEEMQKLALYVKDLTFQLADLSLQLDSKRDEAMQYERELCGARTSVERLSQENNTLRDLVQELEDKNRKLVDKLNQQIMQRVTEYKEKALHALHRSDSPTKVRLACQGIPITDENRDINLKGVLSPVPPQVEQLNAVGKYQVVRELEKLEVSSARGNNPMSQGYKAREVSSFTTSQHPQQSRHQVSQYYEDHSRRSSHSPLRQKSPRIQEYPTMIDANYRRAKESCERMANALGLPATSQAADSLPVAHQAYNSPQNFNTFNPANHPNF